MGQHRSMKTFFFLSFSHELLTSQERGLLRKTNVLHMQHICKRKGSLKSYYEQKNKFFFFFVFQNYITYHQVTQVLSLDFKKTSIYLSRGENYVEDSLVQECNVCVRGWLNMLHGLGSFVFCIQLFRESLSRIKCTRQSRKVIWDMINTLLLTTVAVEPTFVTFLQHSQTYISGPPYDSFKFLWKTVHTGLSRALFPTTFLKIAVYDKLHVHAEILC